MILRNSLSSKTLVKKQTNKQTLGIQEDNTKSDIQTAQCVKEESERRLKSKDSPSVVQGP